MQTDRLARVDENDPLIEQLRRQMTVTGRYRPVYIEPLQGSGERLTCAIGFLLAGGPLVINTINPTLAAGMFGAAGKALFEAANLVADSLRMHLVQATSFDGWEPPFHGVELGPDRSVQAESQQSAIDGTRALWSCLSSLDLNNENTEEHRTSTFVHDVRASMESIHRRFRDSFGQKIPVVSARGHAMEIHPDFFGARFVSGLSRMEGGADYARRGAYQKIVDMELLRQHQKKEQLQSLESREFGLVVLDAGMTSTAKKTLVSLEDFADQHEIRFAVFSKLDDAVDFLVKKEAA